MIRRLALIIALTAIVTAACAKKVPPPSPAPAPPPPPQAAARPPTPPPPAPPPPPPAVAAPAPAPLTEEEIFARKSLDQLNAERPLGDVFFDLDESTIRDDARPILQKNADWMKRWTSAVVTVEGHCDSRASAEYNLALGGRRAMAVKDYLTSLGVQGNRVTVVSKGKEQPVCIEESEACWQQNRRGHFLITAK
jgi:peptidoglycan-associated lipoprotein